MTPETLFSLASTAVLPGWLILIFGPRNRPWLGGIAAGAIPLGLSAVYAVLMLAHFAPAGGGYGSIAEVRTLFASDWVLVAGWVHYLAFDLMVGAWAAARMDAAGISRIAQGFILPLVFLFGPAGALLAWATAAGVRPLAALAGTPREA